MAYGVSGGRGRLGFVVAVATGLLIGGVAGSVLLERPDSAQAGVATPYIADPAMAEVHRVLAKTFPTEYVTLNKQISGMEVTEAQRATFKMIKGLVMVHQADIAAAPDAELIRLAEAQRLKILALSRQSDCRSLGDGSADLALSPDAVPALSAESIAQMRAIRAGREYPVRRTAPSVGDLERLRVALARVAGDNPAPNLTQVSTGPFIGSSPCEAGAAFYRAVASLPPNAAGSVMSAMLSSRALGSGSLKAYAAPALALYQP